MVTATYLTFFMPLVQFAKGTYGRPSRFRNFGSRYPSCPGCWLPSTKGNTPRVKRIIYFRGQNRASYSLTREKEEESTSSSFTWAVWLTLLTCWGQKEKRSWSILSEMWIST